MNQELHINLVTGYLDGTLSEADRQQLQSLIDSGDIDVLDLVDMEKIYRDAGSIDVPAPGPRMHDRFYAMLDKESKKQPAPRTSKQGFHNILHFPSWLQYAAVAATLVIGVLIGDMFAPFSDRDERIDLLSSEVTQMREVLMISLLQNDSPVERLRAVNISQQIPTSEDRVVEALLHTLNTDSNVNVRMAAVNALVERGNNPEVRRGLIESIAQQQSPLVQITLADAMVALQEPSAAPEFEKLLAVSDQMDTNVRTKIENTILTLQ